MMDYDQLYIDGGWVAPSGTDTIEVVSPSTEERVGRVPEATTADVDRAVAAARKAFDTGPWPKMTPIERAEIMAKLSARSSRSATRPSPARSPRRWARRSRGRRWVRSSPPR